MPKKSPLSAKPKTKADIDPEERAWALAQAFARHSWLTRNPLSDPNDDAPFYREIFEIREALEGKHVSEDVVSDEDLERFKANPQELDRFELSGRIMDAILSTQHAAYLYGLARGIALGRGGPQ